MQIMPGLVFGLATTDHELVLLQRHLELVPVEAGDRQGDAKALGIMLRACQTLDIVRGIPVTGGFGDPIERLLDLVEAQEVGMPERRLTRHARSPRLAALRWF